MVPGICVVPVIGVDPVIGVPTVDLALTGGVLVGRRGGERWDTGEELHDGDASDVELAPLGWSGPKFGLFSDGGRGGRLLTVAFGVPGLLEVEAIKLPAGRIGLVGLPRLLISCDIREEGG